MDLYVNKTYKELIAICKENKITGYSKKKKEEIIKLLMNKVHTDNSLLNTIIQNDINSKYRVISLFSGMGGMDIGFAEQVVVHKNSISENNYIESNALTNDFVNLKRLPYEIVFQNDILPDAKKIAELNKWHHNFHLKDIRDMLEENFNFPTADIIIGGFPCFTKDTLVLTNNGYKPIQEVSPHESLLTHTGQFQKIVNIQRKIYNGKLYDLKIKYHPEIITCTEEHPFYNDANELCAISDLATTLAPWLGPIKIVDVPNKIKITEAVTVYNLMLATGESHYANGVRVNNIVKTGGTYALVYRGFLDQASYESHVYNEENQIVSPEQQALIFNYTLKLTNYVLHNDNIRSILLGRLLSWALRNRDTLYPYLDSWFKSRLRRWIFRKNI